MQTGVREHGRRAGAGLEALETQLKMSDFVWTLDALDFLSECECGPECVSYWPTTTVAHQVIRQLRFIWLDQTCANIFEINCGANRFKALNALDNRIFYSFREIKCIGTEKISNCTCEPAAATKKRYIPVDYSANARFSAPHPISAALCRRQSLAPVHFRVTLNIHRPAESGENACAAADECIQAQNTSETLYEKSFW